MHAHYENYAAIRGNYEGTGNNMEPSLKHQGETANNTEHITNINSLDPTTV